MIYLYPVIQKVFGDRAFPLLSLKFVYQEYDSHLEILTQISLELNENCDEDNRKLSRFLAQKCYIL